jgi:oligopeptide/dipeptide ABC transporter ATP-binding protein
MAVIPGVVPSNPGILPGCPFAPRCAYVFEHCTQEVPPLFPIAEGHSSACFLVDTRHPAQADSL